MSQSFTWKGLKLETPAKYRIRVEGHISEDWTGRLGGMTITNVFKKDGQPITVLVGHLPDQASLSGILNALYDFQIPLLSVENLDEEKKNSS
jgi:hypothetical protein